MTIKITCDGCGKQIKSQELVDIWRYAYTVKEEGESKYIVNPRDQKREAHLCFECRDKLGDLVDAVAAHLIGKDKIFGWKNEQR